ncbi:hypothetical protein H4O18_10885 [Arenibacter sp. BSSL-BM3]|uniref:Tetratricopeptide repeat protein n=1 Tax=Arenibacter arenosicollis TaxID=2762274 RepID=A0ABR7QNJ5_9FLAO|nr:DUF6340 family protein [Arenibacter arenosicollis]MBC8768497.1 hypothetical protein [Arenibacter arenosicollis]
MSKFSIRFFASGLLMIIISCSPTKQIVLQTIEPSPVNISKKIKKIGIINRSILPDVEEDETGLNRMVSAEEQWLAEQGRDAALTGLFNELLKDNRFQSIKMLDSVQEGLLNFDTGNDSISWASIEQICQAHNVDAIFSMSYFDAETTVSVKKTSMMQPNLMRVKVKVPAQEITLETLIENGWKIYYPNKNEIIDEFVFNGQVVSKGKGTNRIEAYRAIEGRKDTLVEQSKSTGSNYGQRLLPYENNVERSYFTRGNDNLDLAGKLIENGDLEGASVLWEKDVENSNPRIAGRACYNMAVINEINGDLKSAMEWATKSHTDYDNKEALEYLDVLKNRLTQNQILEQQVSR